MCWDPNSLGLKKIQESKEDRAAEVETLQTSREGIDSLCLDLQTRLKEETQTRLVSDSLTPCAA